MPFSKEKRREYNKKYGLIFRASRSRFLESVKLAAGCVDCGYNDHPAALEFDHVEPGRPVNTCSSWPQLMRELQKVEIRCANHHNIVTQERYDQLRT